MTQYATFLERMRAQHPDAWPTPEPQDAATSQPPQNMMRAITDDEACRDMMRAITDDEACRDMNVDDEHIMTLMALCNTSNARIDLTTRAVHIAALCGPTELVTNTIPLDRLQCINVAFRPYGISLELEFQHHAPQLLEDSPRSKIVLHYFEDFSGTLDLVKEIAGRIHRPYIAKASK